MLETETFKQYEPEEYRPGVHITDDEELVKAGSDYTQTIFHPVGTCKMGQDDMAVVDEKLRVKGIQNLRVIDASIMPNITSGNTNAPTIMIAAGRRRVRPASAMPATRHARLVAPQLDGLPACRRHQPRFVAFACRATSAAMAGVVLVAARRCCRAAASMRIGRTLRARMIRP